MCIKSIHIIHFPRKIETPSGVGSDTGFIIIEGERLDGTSKTLEKLRIGTRKYGDIFDTKAKAKIMANEFAISLGIEKHMLFLDVKV